MPALCILLIEDNPADVRLLREYLLDAGSEQEQFQLLSASYLAKGIELLKTNPIDVVLLDLGLPDSQGMDSFYRLHATNPNIPVILLTSIQDQRTATLAVQAGAQDYLNKNEVNQALLVRTLRYAIERQRSRLALQASEQRLRNMIDQNSIAILVVTPTGHILFANSAAARLFGREVSDLLGGEFGRPIGNDLKTEITIQNPLSGKISAEMEISQTTWEGQSVYLVSLHDITARKTAEEERQAELDLTAALSELYPPLISPEADILDIAREVVRRACQLTHSSAGFISSIDAENHGDAHVLAAMVEQDGQMRLLARMSNARIPRNDQGKYAGLFGPVLNARAPFFSNHPENMPEPGGSPSLNLEVNKFLAVPVLLGERLVGQVATVNPKIDYGEFDLKAVQRLAEFYSLALQRWEVENALRKARDESQRLFQAEREQRELAETMRDVVSLLVSATDQETIFRRLLEQVERAVPFDEAVIYLIEDEHIRAVQWLGYEKFHPDIKNPATYFKIDDFPNLRIMRQTSQPMLNSDTYQHPNWVIAPGTSHIRSYAGVPLKVQGQVIGFLNVHHTQPGFYKERHLGLLSIFGDEVAIALENARLLDEKRQRIYELEVINKVSALLRAAESLDEMLPVFMDGLLEVAGTQSGAIFLADPVTKDLILTVRRGLFENFSTPPIPADDGMIGKVFTSGQTFFSSEFFTNPGKSHLWRKNTGKLGQIPVETGGLCLPLRTARESFGVLVLGFQAPRLPSTGEKHLIETLVDIAGNTFHRMRLHEETEIRLQYLSTLRTIDLAIATSFDLRVTLNVLLEQTLSQLAVDAADILLFNPILQTLDYGSGKGFYSRVIEQTHLQIGQGFAGQAALEGRMIFLPDLRDQNVALNRFDHLAGERFVTYFGVPLMVKGEVKGVLELFQRSLFQPSEEWQDFLDSLSRQAAIAIDNAQLFENLQRSRLELAMAYDYTLEGWSRALDLRDRETEHHTERVCEKSLQLARRMGMGENELTHVRRGALLHDIGKMGVPDHILLKPGPLTEEEWVIMRRHPQIARDLLSQIEYLHPALDIPFCHHEHWDGSGYPRGLQGEQIPKAARIFFVVDVWDALSNDRPYRKAWPKEKVIAYLREQAGVQLDPEAVSQFILLLEEEELEQELSKD
jgi:response regulator RpfG family c-di-GMP phosphodiesterase